MPLSGIFQRYIANALQIRSRLADSVSYKRLFFEKNLLLCAVKNNKTEKVRNIYWNYHCSTADIEWVDDKTVIINGIELDVTKDLYDYRRN